MTRSEKIEFVKNETGAKEISSVTVGGIIYYYDENNDEVARYSLRAKEFIRMNESKDETIKAKVFDALSEIAFKTGATDEQMKIALEWFELHFFDEEEED